MRVRSVVLAAAVTLAPTIARADTDYFASDTTVKVRQEKQRTTGQRVLIYGLLAGAAISAGVGVRYHLDSRDAANEVSTDRSEPLGAWNDELQATYDRAHRSGVVAIVGYSLGGAFLAGAIVAAYLTRPGHEIHELRPASIEVVPGGAVVARSWRF